MPKKVRTSQDDRYEPKQWESQPPRDPLGGDDQELTCQGCRQPFVFTVGEQDFFAQRGFTPPKRCKPCRDQRKQEKAVQGGGR